MRSRSPPLGIICCLLTLETWFTITAFEIRVLHESAAGGMQAQDLFRLSDIA
jgi:hypothetical protein